MTTRDTASFGIGVSMCLLGENVRYDGGSKHDRFVPDTLGPFVEWVPVCPELHDPRLRDNWIERVFAYIRLKSLWANGWRQADLEAFHTNEKLMILAHSPSTYTRRGRLVAAGKSVSRDELSSRYETELMAALTKLATPGRNANVLQHMAGYFKRDLDPGSRKELCDLIDDYRRGLTPLVAPLTLIAHHARRLDVAYLRAQTFLTPHLRELMLRNHV